MSFSQSQYYRGTVGVITGTWYMAVNFWWSVCMYVRTATVIFDVRFKKLRPLAHLSRSLDDRASDLDDIDIRRLEITAQFSVMQG